nr:hypothetical protein HK105_008260 [Polyrhizophydium stewartii]
MQLRPITMRIIVPIVSCSAILCGLCYSVMFFSAAAVHWLELPVSPFALRNNIMRALIALLITAAFAFDLLRKLRDGVVRLIQRIRDDQYLVGRRLHNVDEIPHEALGAQAAPAQ